MVSRPAAAANKSQFAQCAAGAFDRYFRQVGANLEAAGAGHRGPARLGGEHRLRQPPLGRRQPGQVPDYKTCWRRAATALKAGGGSVLMEWTNAKKTQNKALHVADMYPGDDLVDIIGMHYYDSGPEKNTQALWDQYYNIAFNGGPWGIGTWLATSRRAHGKRLGVGRVGRLGPGPAGQRWPTTRSTSTTCTSSSRPTPPHRLRDLLQRDGGPAPALPDTRFPKATAMYKLLWNLGQ